MNLAEATQLATTAGILYPAWWLKLDAPTQRATFAAWASMLEDIALPDGLAALKRHAATNKWPPSVAELRAIVAETHVGRPSAGAEAWGAVRKAVGSVGRYRQPTFTDPVTARVVQALGWRELCDSENEIADRARFIDAYDKLARTAAEDATVAALPGVARPALTESSRQSLERHGARAALPGDEYAPAVAGDLAGGILRALPGGRR